MPELATWNTRKHPNRDDSFLPFVVSPFWLQTYRSKDATNGAPGLTTRSKDSTTREPINTARSNRIRFAVAKEQLDP